MVGIVSYGAYVPRYRLNRGSIFQSIGWFNAATAGLARGEKAVANYDEDSITMSVAAAMDCLKGFARDQVDGLFLGSTTLPYLERQNAAICSAALALRTDIRTADFTASLKSGTTALASACDAVNSGDANNFLVCASDTRLGKPGSGLEHMSGDGASAFLVGTENVLAELKGSYFYSRDFPGYRRTQGERFPQSWEERWIRDEGYGKIIPQVITALMGKCGTQAADISKLVVSCPFIKVTQGIAKKLGFQPEQIQDNLMNAMGDSGSALASMMLVAALEEAKPGDKILVLGFGSGADALLFEVTENIKKIEPRKGVKGHLESKKELESYAKYLVFRDLLPVDVGIRGEETPMARMSVMYREDQTMAALCGSKCKECGTPQFPAQRICANPDCGTMDQMEEYYFHDKIGRINSYTGDNLAFSLDPPGMYGLIDFDEGGRLYLDFTDCELESLKGGGQVRMSFRRKFADKRRGTYSYFWKAVPV